MSVSSCISDFMGHIQSIPVVPAEPQLNGGREKPALKDPFGTVSSVQDSNTQQPQQLLNTSSWDQSERMSYSQTASISKEIISLTAFTYKEFIFKTKLLQIILGKVACAAKIFCLLSVSCSSETHTPYPPKRPPFLSVYHTGNSSF